MSRARPDERTSGDPNEHAALAAPVRQGLHDVAGLLGTIVGFAHLAGAQLATGDAGDARDAVAADLERIQQSASNAAGIVHRLLEGTET